MRAKTLNKFIILKWHFNFIQSHRQWNIWTKRNDDTERNTETVSRLNVERTLFSRRDKDTSAGATPAEGPNT